MRTWVVVAAIVAGVLGAGAEQALAQQTPKGFDEAYNKGQDNYNLGKYDDAWIEFSKARDLDPSKPGPWRWLGRTARAQQKWRECVDSSTQALRLSPRDAQQKITSQYAKDMRQDIDRCRAALGLPAYDGDIPEGQGAAAVIANVEGAAVAIDGIKKGATPLAPIPLQPGKHRVRLERKGYLPADAEVDVVPSIVVDVPVELAVDPQAPLDDRIDVDAGADVKTGWLLVAVNEKTAAVTIDGRSARPGADGSIEEDPGIHTLEVTAEGYEPYRRRVVVVRGQKRAVRVDLKKTVDRRREQRIAYIAFGVAALAGGAGAVFGLLENGAYEDAEDIRQLETTRPTGSMLPPGLPESEVHSRQDLDDAVAKGERYGLISNISYGVAAVALGVSIYYFIRERDDQRAGELPMAIVPVIDPTTGGAGVVYARELDW